MVDEIVSVNSTYTKEKTKQSKTNFYYSFLFLPKAKREAIYTVYSFCRETDDIVDNSTTPDDACRKLNQWRSELDACYDEEPAHPITKALLDVQHSFPLPKEYFHALIDGCEMDLTRKRYSTFDDLADYCYRVASVVGLICIEIFGYRTPQTKDYAVNLGKALQLTNIMRDVGEDARLGRIYLPLEDLERFKLSENDLINETYSPAFVEMMKFQGERAQHYYDLATSLYEHRDHHLLFPAEIMRKIYHTLLNGIVKANYNVFDNRVRVPNSKKMSIALKTWLGSRLTGAMQWGTTP